MASGGGPWRSALASFGDPFRTEEWVLHSPHDPAACAERILEAAPRCPRVGGFDFSNRVCRADDHPTDYGAAGIVVRLRRTARRNYPQADVRLTAVDDGALVDVRSVGLPVVAVVLLAVVAGSLVWVFGQSVLVSPDPWDAVVQAARGLAILAAAYAVLVPDFVAVQRGYAPFLAATLDAYPIGAHDGATIDESRAWWWRFVGW